MIKDKYDIAVIGGGIQGVGVTQAAAAAGYSVIVIEQKHWASGTSSRSSKLIHGGLRYLESAQLNLVRECLNERETLLKVAPHLVQAVAFQIPVYQQTVRRSWQLWCGLALYGLLAGFTPMARFKKMKPGPGIELDGLSPEQLQAVFSYWDAQTDDSALTHAVLASARELGADSLCPGVFHKAERCASGFQVFCQDSESSQPSFECSVLVNAGGPWVNSVQNQIFPKPKILDIDLVKGSHIILEGQQSDKIFYLEAPQDQRAVFVMPWKGDTMIGTTEMIYQGDPGKVSASEEEINYLLGTYQHYFPTEQRKLLDSFAGLRVLPKEGGSAFNRSRETQLLYDNESKPSLATIYGGKLTSYRAVAEKVVKQLSKSLGARSPKADTRTLLLPKLAG